MRLLFVHDHRFLRGPGGAVYTQGSFPAAVWERYLEHFDGLTVLARDGGELAGENLARADHPKVRFALVAPPSLAERLGLIGGGATRALRAAIAEADGVIVRLPSDLGLLGAAAAERAGRPCLIEAVGCAYDAYANQGSRAARLYARLAMRRMRRAIGRARFVLYVTERWLQGRYPPRPGVITGHASNVFIDRPPPTAWLRAKRASPKSSRAGPR